jgi:hypothetical protein
MPAFPGAGGCVVNGLASQWRQWRSHAPRSHDMRFAALGRNDKSPMPHGSVIETIPASSTEVFRLLHDYDRRLEWDTLLRDARLCAPWTEAQLHATSVCTSRWYLGGLAVKTEYISFHPPQVAAVKMLNRPPFFAGFAATIRHRDLSEGASSVEYKYTFTARPSWLRWLLNPVMAALFRWETRKRLRALRRFFLIADRL